MVQFSSVASLCRTLRDPMDCSTSDFPVYHQLPELAQTHVRWVLDAIQPSHSLSYPSPPAFSLSQHQSLFQWVSSSHQVAKVLEAKVLQVPISWYWYCMICDHVYFELSRLCLYRIPAQTDLPGAGILHIECILHIAYWVQHFPQHHLSGSGIAQLELYHCQEPAWGTPPVAKVMRKEARHTQRRDRASGVPLEILEHLPPKPESAYFLLCAFTYTSDFTGAVPHYLSLKKELAYSSS